MASSADVSRCEACGGELYLAVMYCPYCGAEGPLRKRRGTQQGQKTAPGVTTGAWPGDTAETPKPPPDVSPTADAPALASEGGTDAAPATSESPVIKTQRVAPPPPTSPADASRRPAGRSTPKLLFLVISIIALAAAGGYWLLEMQGLERIRALLAPSEESFPPLVPRPSPEAPIQATPPPTTASPAQIPDTRQPPPPVDKGSEPIAPPPAPAPQPEVLPPPETPPEPAVDPEKALEELLRRQRAQ